MNQVQGMSAADTIRMREVTKRKYLAIQKRFNHLYNERRLRLDDCIEKIKEEYFMISDRSVMKILATEVTLTDERSTQISDS